MKTVLKLCAAGLVASAALSAHAELKIGVDRMMEVACELAIG